MAKTFAVTVFAVGAWLLALPAHAATYTFSVGSGAGELSFKSGVLTIATTQTAGAENCPKPPMMDIGAGISAGTTVNAFRDAYEVGACSLVDPVASGNLLTVEGASSGSIHQTGGLYSEVNLQKKGGGGITPGPSDIAIPTPKSGNLALIIKDFEGNDVPVTTTGLLALSLIIDGATAQLELPFDPSQTTQDINDAIARDLSGFMSPSGIGFLGVVDGYPTFGGPHDYDFFAALFLTCTGQGSPVVCGPDNEPGFGVGAIHAAFVPEPASWLILVTGLLALGWCGNRTRIGRRLHIKGA